MHCRAEGRGRNERNEGSSEGAGDWTFFSSRRLRRWQEPDSVHTLASAVTTRRQMGKISCPAARTIQY